jgi:carbonic anhydrase/acetyltransferase-like protein (isoleucine patch superfamily)
MSIRSFRGITPTLADSVWVDQQACVIGDVSIGEDCSIWPGAVLRGDMHKIVIGHRVSVQDGAVLHNTHSSDFNPDGYPLTIGSDVTIGHNACLHGCTIGNEVLIGIGAIILDGVHIPDQVMIAAGSLVPPGKQLESGYLYVGNPAKQARPLKGSEREFFKYTAKNYKKLKDEYKLEEA